MELTSLQLKTVNSILELYNPLEKVICEFKSPTGSGKTLMASHFISALIDQNPNDKFIFVIATPSSSSLPLFFEQKINKYKIDLPYSKFNVEYIQSPSSVKSDKSESISRILPEQNKVYIFGKASFGKGRILSEYGIINDFVISSIDKGYKLIYIRDEAHIGGEKVDNSENAKSFENIMNENASFILKMTATPNMKNHYTKKVILKEKDLNNPVLNDGKYLLKTKPVSLLDKNLEDKDILKNAISRYKEIKEKYESLNINIHPAMLIQVDNDSSDKEKSKIFSEKISEIKMELQNSGLKWVQYFGNDDKDSNRVYKNNFSLDDITENNNEIDVIIFKIGPATGWDIPRACMLLQLRKVSSSKLNIQTIGRIKRNPYPNLELNPITDEYYIYSNIEDADKDVKTYTYQLKDKYVSETFLSIDILNKKDLINSKPSIEFNNRINQYLEDNKSFIIQELNDTFINKKEYRKLISRSGTHQIYSTITNPFVFLRDYRRLIYNNKPIYDKIKESVEKFAKKINIQKEFLYVIILNNRKADILNLISKTKEFKPIYKVREESYDPKSYVEIYNLEKDEEKISSRKEYLFGINEDTNHSNRQPLDSEPETYVFSKIDDFVSDCDNVKLWAKNLTSSNIFGEYLDDINNVRKSFFDFVLKFENGLYLYIEVKGIPDINEEKTKCLEKAYTDYFNNIDKDFFSPKLVICVWKVSDNGDIKSTVYYDRNLIKDDLNVLSANELLKKLSEVKI